MNGHGSDEEARPPEEQLARLRLLERAASGANRSTTAEEAAEAVLAAACEFGGWPAARFVPATGGAALWCYGSGGTAPCDRSFTVPVVLDGAVVGAMEFFSDRSDVPDGATLDALARAGEHLGRSLARVGAAVALRRSEERYRLLAEWAPDAIVMADADGTIVSLNRSAQDLLGYAAEELAGRPFTVLLPALGLHGGEWPPAGRATEMRAQRRDGGAFPAEVSLSRWETSEGTFLTGIIRDITERREAERDRQAFEHGVDQRALHDPLTSLANRALLHDRLHQAVARAARHRSSVAVVSIDLDRFRDVNEDHGHHVGDQLLVAVADRLRQTVRAGDTLARTHADRFVVVCEDVEGPAGGLQFAERMHDALGGLFVVDGNPIPITASIGVAVSPVPPADPDQLLRDAETAVARVRQEGLHQAALYEPSMGGAGETRLSVEQDLRRAIREGELRLHYQPVVEVNSGIIHGVEALVRWQHPVRGLLAPTQFIGLAEDTGLIVPLGRWVLEQACRQGAAWQREAAAPTGRLRMSVNVSARQFQQPEWTDEVAHVLLTTGFAPEQLVLEITESILMEDTEATSHRLAELRQLGVRIAIDDFGTGYSSLGYLRQFPVDILKVDKSFVDGIAEGPHDSALARAVIKLAATLHLESVAEGVSNRRQLEALRRLRCRFAQGFHFAPPQPADSVTLLFTHPLVAGDALEAPERAVS